MHNKSVSDVALVSAEPACALLMAKVAKATSMCCAGTQLQLLVRSVIGSSLHVPLILYYCFCWFHKCRQAARSVRSFITLQFSVCSSNTFVHSVSRSTDMSICQSSESFYSQTILSSNKDRQILFSTLDDAHVTVHSSCLHVKNT